MKQFQIPSHLMNLYPPLIGAGIRVKEASRAGDRVVVHVKLTWRNAKVARTHVGGSLYMEVDPFQVLMLKQQLGVGECRWSCSPVGSSSLLPSAVRQIMSRAPAEL